MGSLVKTGEISQVPGDDFGIDAVGYKSLTRESRRHRIVIGTIVFGINSTQVF